jgi:hypothetical protein
VRRASPNVNFDLLVANLLTPPVLFFALGFAATLVKSDLEIPQPVAKALSLYLLFAIGLHGGAELSASNADGALVTLAAATALSALLPIATFFLLRRRVGAADAAAIAATYGSISAVTFITATSFLDMEGIVWSGHLVAAMALMESPAILVAVALARSNGVRAPDLGPDEKAHGPLREAFLSGPVFLLLGALAIGWACGESGWKRVEPFAKVPFQGVLCLFLLDMGLVAARRVAVLRNFGVVLVVYALVAPLVHGAIGLAVAYTLDLSVGDAILFVVLCASASYIAVPAAVRATLPDANPGVFLPMSLAVTFPFNVAIGIPLYAGAVQSLWSTP